MNKLDLSDLSRDELRSIAKHHGVPLRLTKAEMVAALESVPSVKRDLERGWRDQFHATPVTLYDPADQLDDRDHKFKRSLNRFARRHTVVHVQTKSRNPLRPAVVVLTTSLRTRDGDGNRVKLSKVARFGHPGALVPATKDDLGDWR